MNWWYWKISEFFMTNPKTFPSVLTRISFVSICKIFSIFFLQFFFNFLFFLIFLYLYLFMHFHFVFISFIHFTFQKFFFAKIVVCTSHARTHTRTQILANCLFVAHFNFLFLRLFLNWEFYFLFCCYYLCRKKVVIVIQELVVVVEVV